MQSLCWLQFAHTVLTINEIKGHLHKQLSKLLVSLSRYSHSTKNLPVVANPRGGNSVCCTNYTYNTCVILEKRCPLIFCHSPLTLLHANRAVEAGVVFWEEAGRCNSYEAHCTTCSQEIHPRTGAKFCWCWTTIPPTKSIFLACLSPYGLLEVGIPRKENTFC